MGRKTTIVVPKDKVDKEEAAKLLQRTLDNKKRNGKVLVIRLGRAE